MQAMTGNAPTFATLFLRVFLPFTFAYFLSYIFRGVNAVIFPYLERDVGITAGDLGLLTSAFFLFFAGCQPVLGVALDRYGPRRVQAVLLAVAAAGSALFGLSLSLGELVLARALIGLGFAGGLMAAIKAITLWVSTAALGRDHRPAHDGGRAGLDGRDTLRAVVALAHDLAGPVFLAGRDLPRQRGDPVGRRAQARRDPIEGYAGRAVPHHRHRADRRLLLAHPAAAVRPAARLHRLHHAVDRTVAARRRRHPRRDARRYPARRPRR